MDKKKKFKFDVVIGNPPYQEEDGGNAASAMPVYDKFVEAVKNIANEELSFIVPARWYAGGRGLDNFRNTMLNDSNIKLLVDYPNTYDVFPNVDIAGGVCYFLWKKGNDKITTVKNVLGNYQDESIRNLNEYPVFIRSNKAIDIVNKIRKMHTSNKYLDEVVSPSRPFGIRTFYKPKTSGIPCWFIQKYGKQYADKNDITDNFNLLNKWKFLAPRSPIAGQTDFTKPVGFYYDGNTNIAAPGECCTESFIVLGAFDTREETESFKSYIFTKMARFLLLQAVVSQDVTRKKFCFVPDLGNYEGTYTDEILCDMWNITKEEWNYIDSRINNINPRNK